MRSLALKSPSTLMLFTQTLLVSSLLAGCGNDSNNHVSSQHNPPSAKPSQGFSQTAQWRVNTQKAGESCYDFDSKAEVACSSDVWDVKLEHNNRAYKYKLWTNGGTSGNGRGGALGLRDWQTLKTYQYASYDPKTKQDISRYYQEDKPAGIFSDEPWYAYGLKGKHQLYPNNRVYLITLDSSNHTTTSSVQAPVYALQIIGFYDEKGTSGYPTIRYIDVANPNNVNTKTIDASAHDKWAYFNLKTNQITSENQEWHIAFKRTKVKLNGGDSGQGKVGGYLAKTPTGYYDEKNQPITNKFASDNSKEALNELKDIQAYDVKDNQVAWIQDTFSSELNPTYKGKFPVLDYGWYTYDGRTHKLSAKPESVAEGALIRSAEGNSYARMRLKEIGYADGSPSPTNFVYHFDIQPK